MKLLFYFAIICIAVTACNKSSQEVKVRVIDESIKKLKPHDVKLDKVAPGDWLDEHLESGQTFEQYIKIKPVSSTRDRNRIYLQPILEN